MDVNILYECKDNVQTVPHLILDLFYVNYSREEEDYNIILALCMKFQTRVIETIKHPIPVKNFLLSDFDSDFGSQKDFLFANNIRYLIFDTDEFRWYFLCEFMLSHCSAGTVELLIYGDTSEKFYKNVLNNISHLILPNNFYLRNIIINTRTKMYDLIPEESKNQILKRNMRIFSRKRNIATILLGMSKFRNVSKILSKDVMNLIAKEIFYMHPAQVYIIKNSLEKIL